MTLQVVMVGRDGVVLASDTAETAYSGEQQFLIRTRTDVSKITNVAKWKFTYAPSGDECAVKVGERLEREIESNHGIVTKELLEDVGSKVINEEKVRFKAECRNWDERARTLLMVCYGAEVTVWRLRIESVTKASRITGQAIAGDESNVARLLIERYYNPNLNLAVLKLLATFFIGIGHLQNSAMVGEDIEMAVFAGSTTTIVSREELARLRDKAERLDSMISSALKNDNTELIDSSTL